MEDLTKLSRPELAARLDDGWDDVSEQLPVVREAQRRLREIDQRDERIEDLSAQVRAADKRALAAEREIALVRGNLERERDHLREQIDKLASFILAEVPGEPSQNEGAVDTAVRIIRKSQARIAELEAEAKAYHEHMAKWEAQLKSDAAALAGAPQPAERKAIAVGDKVRKHGWPDSGIVREILPGGNYHHVVWDTGTTGDYHSSELEVLRPAQPEPAERKAQEERLYGPYKYTLDKVVREHGHARTLYNVFSHLRETLAKLDAVRALADEWASAGPYHGAITYAYELREVLNGKR